MTNDNRNTRASKAVHVVFVVLASVIFLSALTGAAASKLFPNSGICDHELDAGATPIDDENIASTSQILSDPIGSILNGDIFDKIKKQLTTQADNAIKESIPLRDSLLLLSAKMGRLGIESANLLCRYDALPTYYGAWYVYYPEYGAVYYSPSSLDSEKTSTADTMLAEYVKLVNQYPSVNWCFYVADWCTTFSGNPAIPLVSNCATYDECFQLVAETLPASAKVVYDGYSSFDEYLEYHYRTDHHWNIRGALRGYRAIADALGLTYGEESPEEVANASSTGFYGSCGRGGLTTEYEDAFEDVIFPMGNLTVTINGKQTDPSDLDYLNGTGTIYSKSSTFENLYSACFHSVGDEVLIENEECRTGTLLIVADSYSIPIERLFSPHFHRVVAYDPRYSDMSIYDYIEKYEPDTVISIQRCDNIFKDNFLSVFTSEKPGSTE